MHDLANGSAANGQSGWRRQRLSAVPAVRMETARIARKQGSLIHRSLSVEPIKREETGPLTMRRRFATARGTCALLDSRAKELHHARIARRQDAGAFRDAI